MQSHIPEVSGGDGYKKNQDGRHNATDEAPSLFYVHHRPLWLHSCLTADGSTKLILVC